MREFFSIHLSFAKGFIRQIIENGNEKEVSK